MRLAFVVLWWHQLRRGAALEPAAGHVRGTAADDLVSIDVDYHGQFPSLVRRGHPHHESSLQPEHTEVMQQTAPRIDEAEVFKPGETGNAPEECLWVTQSMFRRRRRGVDLMELQTGTRYVQEADDMSQAKGDAEKELLKMINRELSVEIFRSADLVGRSIVFKIIIIVVLITVPAACCGMTCSCILPYQYNAYIDRQQRRMNIGMRAKEPKRYTLEWLHVRSGRVAVAVACLLFTAKIIMVLIVWYEVRKVMMNFHPKPLEQFIVQLVARVAEMFEEVAQDDDWDYFLCEMLFAGKQIRNFTVENAASASLAVERIQGDIALDGTTIFNLLASWPELAPHSKGVCSALLKASKIGLALRGLKGFYTAFAEASHFFVIGFDLTADGSFGGRPFHARAAIGIPCQVQGPIFEGGVAGLSKAPVDDEAILKKLTECIPSGLEYFRSVHPPRYMLDWSKTEIEGYYVEMLRASLIILGIIWFFVIALFCGIAVETTNHRHKLLPPIKSLSSSTSVPAGRPKTAMS